MSLDGSKVPGDSREEELPDLHGEPALATMHSLAVSDRRLTSSWGTRQGQSLVGVSMYPWHLALQSPAVVHMSQRLLPFIAALRESKAVRNSLSPARIYTTSLVLGFPGSSSEVLSAVR